MRNLKQKEVCLTLCVAKDRIIPDILHHTGAVVHSYHSQCLFHCLKEIDLKISFLGKFMLSLPQELFSLKLIAENVSKTLPYVRCVSSVSHNLSVCSLQMSAASQA